MGVDDNTFLIVYKLVLEEINIAMGLVTDFS